MVALPGQLFTNTQIPACIWFLTWDKANGMVRNEKKRDRREEFLFIDARNLGFMRDRVLRDFTNEDIAKVADTFHAWQRGEGYDDVAGFCKSASLDEIKKHDFVLTPGRYVGAQEQEDDGEPFAVKMARLTGQLREQFAESDRLEAEIKRNLGGLGYEL
jgi:type I restriction enzyme M protein